MACSDIVIEDYDWCVSDAVYDYGRAGHFAAMAVEVGEGAALHVFGFGEIQGKAGQR